MSHTGQGEPLQGRDLLLAVRDLIAENQHRGDVFSRFDQTEWVANQFGSYPEVRVEDIRAVMHTPVMVLHTRNYACGTRGCAAGWGAILGAPDGSIVVGSQVFLPDGTRRNVSGYAAERFGISEHTAVRLFNSMNSTPYMITALSLLAGDPRADISRVGADGRVYDGDDVP